MQNKSPFTSDHENKDRKLFDAISSKYLEKDIAMQSVIARKYRLMSSLKNVEFHKNTRVLEVGCGAGFSVKYLDKPFAEFVGVDYSQGLIDYATQYNSTEGARFICANIKEYDSEDKFDVIFMIGVLHHFDNMQEIMNHIVELLKPGGIVVANEPQGSNWLIQGLRKFRTKIDKSYSDDQVQLMPTDLERIFLKSGLKNVELFGQGYFSTPFAEVILKPVLVFNPLSKIFVSLDKMISKYFSKIGLGVSWNIVSKGFKQ